MINLRYSWRPYLEYGQKLELKENEFIYHQGEEGKGFFYLEGGVVKITLLSSEGVERTVNFVPEGMLFGEHGVYQKPYLTTAITTCPSVIYFFSDESFKKICLDDLQAGNLFAHSLVYKFRTLAEIISFLKCPFEQQMAHFLLKLVSENGTFSMDQTAFARYIGTSRITINKILNKWKTDGLIQFSNRTVQILDYEGLKELRNVGAIDLPNLDLLTLTRTK